MYPFTTPAQVPLPGMEADATPYLSTEVERYEPPSASTIAEDSGGVVRPAYVTVSCPARELSRGDLVVDPVLGELRVVYVADFGYDEVRHEPLCQVHWVSDDGMGTLARMLLTTAMVNVRLPAREDVQAIRHGLALAARHRREIDPYTARLIAAHLQRGPGSALYAFAVSCAVTDRLYDELNELRPANSADLARWIHALANHCLNRTDHRQEVQPAPRRCGPAQASAR